MEWKYFSGYAQNDDRLIQKNNITASVTLCITYYVLIILINVRLFNFFLPELSLA